MKNSENYYKTRDLCESLCKTVGLTRHVTHSFTRLIKEGLVHQVAEKALEVEDTCLKYIDIEIPFIGTLSLEYSNRDIKILDIKLEEEFKKQMILAISEGKSPLISSSETSLVNLIKSRYDALL